jgi:hypothetical protein
MRIVEFSNRVDAVDIDNEDIIEWMNRIVQRSDKDDYGYLGSISSGNTYVNAYRTIDGEVEFVICKNYLNITLENYSNFGLLKDEINDALNQYEY